jgi:hypothetical protein
MLIITGRPLMACRSYLCKPSEYSKTLNLCFKFRMEYIIFRDTINLAYIVKFGKKYFNFKGIQACCRDKYFILESTEWWTG